VSLLHVNADQTPAAAIGLGEEFFRDRYTIGVWAWELEEFPDAFLPAFNHVQEVWAPSRFIHEAVAEKSPVPVVHMPFVVTAAPAPGISRQDFGLPQDGFLFLMMYDTLSIQERKNPLGALEAFRRAFPSRSRVGLVIRVNHAASRPEDVAIVRQQAANTAGVFLLDRPMSRRDAQALHLSCDAFVSLHRSEGLGLNIAEAMLLNKPVVVTGWSGNMDFTTHQNACLVDYELVTLSMDYGPYRQGNRWAEPDLDHAAELMVRLVEDTAFRHKLAASGRTTIARQFSAHAVGARYLRRVAAIRRWM
jgi:glycosyltransferase involved in cell wall biosynthesis